jgi:hypothetical protein
MSFDQLSDGERASRVSSLFGTMVAEREKQATEIALWREVYFQINGYVFAWKTGDNTWTEIGEGSQGKCYTTKFKEKNAVVKLLKGLSESKLISEISWLHNIWCIGHPNIVPPITLADGQVLTFLDDDGLPTITMVEIEGHSVEETDFSDWTTFDRIWAFVQMADCLNVLHKYGLFHSDLHRMNIIIRNDKTPIIVDLGTMCTAEKSRKMDINSLFELMFDFKLDEDPNCPLLFKKWYNDFTQGDRTSMPDTIERVCHQLGEMSIGQLVTIRTEGGKVVYPCYSGNGFFVVSFSTQRLRFEDYAKEVIGPNVRERQQQAIQKYLSMSAAPKAVS